MIAMLAAAPLLFLAAGEESGPIAQEAYLKASNTDASDAFGRSVAISGDTIVVGANEEASNATGVDGDGSDNSAPYAGAAYVFARSGTSWSQQAYLKPSNTDGGDYFGESVAVSGDTVVVGSWAEASNATGIDGDQSDNSAWATGAAYVFVRDGTSWSQQAYIKASNAEEGDAFGRSVAAYGDTLIVGAGSEDGGATGVNGDDSDNSVSNSGAAYVFVRNGSSWSQQAYLKASNTGSKDIFGTSVSLSADIAVVGAMWEESSATGVNGDQNDNSFIYAGAVYVFTRSGTGWIQEAYLKASNTDVADHFGRSVAVSGRTVVVGALDEDSNATGVNGDQNDNSALYAGAAYVFARGGTSWNQLAYLKASNTDENDRFGRGVATFGGTTLVGAPGEGSGATGVNGNQGDNSHTGAGAAYVFTTPPGSGFCFGDPGHGIPCPCDNDNDGSVPGSGCDNGVFASGAQLTGSGEASVSSDSLVLTTIGLEPLNTGLYFQGTTAPNNGSGFWFGDGLRCAGGGVIRLQVRFSNASGVSFTTLPIGTKGGVSAGDVRTYQCWYRNQSTPACGLGVNEFNLSNGYRVAWLP